MKNIVEKITAGKEQMVEALSYEIEEAEAAIASIKNYFGTCDGNMIRFMDCGGEYMETLQNAAARITQASAVLASLDALIEDD